MPATMKPSIAPKPSRSNRMTQTAVAARKTTTARRIDGMSIEVTSCDLAFLGCYPQHAQFLAITVEWARQLQEHPLRIQTVGARLPRASIHLDRGGLQHMIVDATTHQFAMQLEAIATRFAAALHRCILRRAETRLSPPHPLWRGDEVGATW